MHDMLLLFCPPSAHLPERPYRQVTETVSQFTARAAAEQSNPGDKRGREAEKGTGPISQEAEKGAGSRFVHTSPGSPTPPRPLSPARRLTLISRHEEETVNPGSIDLLVRTVAVGLNVDRGAALEPVRAEIKCAVLACLLFGTLSDDPTGLVGVTAGQVSGVDAKGDGAWLVAGRFGAHDDVDAPASFKVGR